MYKFGKETSILTETLPVELPLIYNNRKLYEYIKENKEDFLKCDIHRNKDSIFTVPFTYLVKKNESEFRKLSLLHPIGQMQVANVLMKYDNLLLSFFNNNSIFSIRRPVNLNDRCLKIQDKHKYELEWIENNSIDNLLDEKNELVSNYFTIKKFKTITSFYKSDYVKYLELKYKNLIRLDYTNCFESIYTHSIEWAYVGNKNIIKDDLTSNRFSAKLDILAQRVNYNETNGLVVGPEISRTLAEIVFTRIDKNIYFDLKDKNIIYKKDYEIARFIDDIMIFYNDENIGNDIKHIIEKNSREYKLKINNSKTKYESRPFFSDHMWITHLKRSIKEFLNFYEKTITYKEYPYYRFMEEVKDMICAYSNNKRYIISYVLSAIEDKIIYIIQKLTFSKNADLIKYHYIKLIDMLIYIINYYISFDNSIKLCRLIYKIKKSCKENNIHLEDFIFKKISSLLYYNEKDISSLLNLIILLADNTNFLSEKYILNILKTNNDYFTISVITYYILKKDSDYYTYESVKELINKIVKDALDYVEFRYGNISNYNGIIKILKTDKFYTIHDLYSSGILDDYNKQKINSIKTSINNRCKTIETVTIEKLFLEFIKELDKPFMDWNIESDQIIKELIISKSRHKKIYN